MHNNIDTLFSHLWEDYVSITPSAEKIHALLKQQTNSSDIVNDHVAFRTFNLPKTGLQTLAQHFEALGYTAQGDYNFDAKKLSAKHYQHPDPTKPKVFISELRVEELSDTAQDIIHGLVEQMPADAVNKENYLYSGTHWNVSKAEYETLLEESEYAAWMAAWGYRANHFTVSVNHLNGLATLEDVNQTLKDAGYVLNTSGGEIKGGRDVCLAQSSTMADKMPVAFSDVELAIPSCFYEFAERFEMAEGGLYQGFVAASADKIFESTNAGM
ncbi:DUF1338 domain-containing protein [Alteromonas sediminis]|uniref:2-oxoadipate dioxygenase/decarboxylase n=1 Tax=Alteromonas sediminis TaxID=2259342 RepID=A0A3N5YBJ7_9ALTE|nr:DUF1338 domain-containing protein [Alteromonas sediminis]RPJ66385.1 DUF1338 domain-containing protein [Alteromonas sediminis]